MRGQKKKQYFLQNIKVVILLIIKLLFNIEIKIIWLKKTKKKNKIEKHCETSFS